MAGQSWVHVQVLQNEWAEVCLTLCLVVLFRLGGIYSVEECPEILEFSNAPQWLSVMISPYRERTSVLTYTRTALETFKLHWPCMHTFVENKMHNSFLCLSVYRSASFLFGLGQSDGCGDASDRIGLSYLLLEDDRETHSDISNYKYNAQSVNLDNYERNAAVLFFCMLEFLMAVFPFFDAHVPSIKRYRKIIHYFKNHLRPLFNMSLMTM